MKKIKKFEKILPNPIAMRIIRERLKAKEDAEKKGEIKDDS